MVDVSKVNNISLDDIGKINLMTVPTGAGGTVERLVRASVDDISVHWSGAAWVANYTVDYWIVGYFSATYQKMGGAGRFLNIYVPKDASITHAYLKLLCRTNDNAVEVKTRLYGEKTASPAVFSDYANYAARTRTDAVVDFDDIETWVVGTLYSSPDIKSIIEEIVALPDWASGNSLVIFWDDHDDRTAHIDDKVRRGRSWDNVARNPPMLYIEWVA